MFFNIALLLCLARIIPPPPSTHFREKLVAHTHREIVLHLCNITTAGRQHAGQNEAQMAETRKSFTSPRTFSLARSLALLACAARVWKVKGWILFFSSVCVCVCAAYCVGVGHPPSRDLAPLYSFAQNSNSTVVFPKWKIYPLACVWQNVKSQVYLQRLATVAVIFLTSDSNYYF